MPNDNQRPTGNMTSKSKLLANRRLVFDDFEYYPYQQKLLYQGTLCQLEPRMLQLIDILIEKRPQLVTKEELMQKLWPDAVVSDWSLARLVSDTRKLIEDDGKQQSIIKTVRGKGFAFAAKADEIIQAYQAATESDQTETQSAHTLSSTSNNNSQSPKNKSDADKHSANSSATKPQNEKLAAGWLTKKLSVVVLAVLVIGAALIFIYIKFLSPQSVHDQPAHRLQVMYEIQKNLRLTKTTYLAQKRRRNELKESLIAKSPEKTPLSSERRIRLHYPHLTSQERFIFDQIRAMTEGPMYQGNTQILTLLKQHPELFREIETFHALYNHLSIWKSKFDRVFVHQPDMCFVFVGEEDGVPFPSEIDGLVDDWISQQTSSD